MRPFVNLAAYKFAPLDQLPARRGRLLDFCLARGLREKLGLAPGDRVALVMTNAAEYPEILLGIWWAGLAAVPVNAKLHPREVAYILGNSGAKAVFATPDLPVIL